MGKINMTNTNTENKQYFTQKEALEMVLETIENGCDDLLVYHTHNETFEYSYYIDNKIEAKKALEQYGVLEALQKVVNYELLWYGKTDLQSYINNYEYLANMLMHVVGEEALNIVTSIKYYTTLNKKYGDEGVLNDIATEIKNLVNNL